MPVNVADFDNLIKEFMIANIKTMYPNLDTSDGSVFDDQFIKPMQSIIRPLIAAVNSLELRQNLNNAEYMEESELDDIGMGNYLMPRKTGQKSTATITMSFASLPVSGILAVPAGIMFSTSDGLQFETTDDKQFTLTELYTMYNTSTMNYDVTVNTQALDIGSNYNVGGNQITKCENWPDQTLVSITNKVPADGGTDQESNVDYAQRLKEYYISRHLGTPYGFKQFILEAFSEIQDIYVSGKNDKFMKRDTFFDPGNVIGSVVGTVTNGTVITLTKVDGLSVGEDVIFYKLSPYTKTDMYEIKAIDTVAKTITLESPVTVDSNWMAVQAKHIGGKVDIYIKGSNFVTETVDIPINSNNLFLQTDYDKIVLSSFILSNKTDTTKTVTYTSQKDAATSKCVIKLLNPDANHMSYDPSTASEINVYYKYTDSEGAQVEKVETFTVGKTTQELMHPFKSVIDIRDSVTKTSYMDPKYYSLIQTGIVGTSQEDTSIDFTAETDIIPNGHILEATYSINDTINALDQVFNYEENRVVTTDILFKEAEQVYVNLSFKVKLKDNQPLDDFKINTIKNSAAEFFLQAPLGQQVQESDFVAWLYNDDNVSAFLDFIALPLDSFYVTTDVSALIETKRDGTYLNASEIQYPVLNKISVTSL